MWEALALAKRGARVVLLGRTPERLAARAESIVDLMLSYADRHALNGALDKLDKRIEKPDKAMNEQELGSRLWDELVRLTELAPEVGLQVAGKDRDRG